MNRQYIINTDDIKFYIKDIKKIPLIPSKRQEEIFKSLKYDKLTDSERKSLTNEIILGNLRFVITVSKQYQNKGLDLLDLISEGNLGLIKSIEKFDPDSGNKFISYAVWWIRQMITSALNEHSRTIRIPSNLISKSQQDKKEIEKNSQNYIILEPHEKYNLPYCTSLSSPINNTEFELIDVVRDPNENNPEDILNTKDEKFKRVSQMLSNLDEREREIIINYFGLNGVEYTLEDMVSIFGCTKERIRQIKEKALLKLRNESYELFKYL